MYHILEVIYYNIGSKKVQKGLERGLLYFAFIHMILPNINERKITMSPMLEL
jgi:hypothetical protein